MAGSKRSEILGWISNIPYTSHHKHISEGRLKGTGEWLFGREEYRAWRSSSASLLLLLRGIRMYLRAFQVLHWDEFSTYQLTHSAGAGKTYIASTVIDSLSSTQTPEKLAYFYCNRAEENRREPQSILNTLIQQLAQTESEKNKLLKPVVDVYRSREEKGQTSSHLSLGDSQELLIQLMDIYPQTTICIDALDEVETKTRLHLLKALKNIISKTKNLVKVFATTRMDTDILRQLEMFPRIVLQPDDNIGDINQFVKAKLQSSINDGLLLEGDVPDGLKIEIYDVLCKRSKGMYAYRNHFYYCRAQLLMMNCRFQLAALQIDFICEMPTPDDVRRSLRVLPDTLKDAYGEIYKRILDQKGSAPRLALSAFRWIQCSYEPLCSETLLDAIAVEISDQGEFSRKGTITVNGLLKVCQNLLVFDKQLNVFRFAHLSVDEYLETELRNSDSQTEIAKVCLSLLCTPTSWKTYDETLRTTKGRYWNRHLLLYSAVFWPWHFSHCGDINDQMLTRLCNTLVSETNHQRWLDYHCLSVEFRYPLGYQFWHRVRAFELERNDPLFSLCVFGLSPVFETVFKSKPIIEKACMNQLLLTASKFGELAIARFLIDEGADVSEANKDGWTPLFFAAWEGHESVAQLLIDRGADVLAADNDSSTPLHFAVREGHLAVARVLMDKGANVSAANKAGQTPLFFAVLGGHEPVARLLISGGADLSAADQDSLTPLHFAACEGHWAVARLLIDGGANISAADKDGWTPLLFAAREGREPAARLLIDGGADVSVADKDGWTPLHFAALGGLEPVTRLLIDGGADVSAASKDGWTPLLFAAREGYEPVARLLVDGGADVSAASKDGWTPLLFAAREGHEPVARLLVDGGADVSAAGMDSSTPLHFAAQRGHLAVARLLIDRGADVSATDMNGWTPQSTASALGHEEMVQVFLDRVDDVSVADKDGQTPLRLTMRDGHEAAA